MSIIDRAQSASLQYNIAHTIPRSKGILGVYADTLLAIMTQYLEVPETVQLLQASRCFQETANARSLWQLLFKKHNPNWQSSRLHLFIQSQIQDQISKEVAYKCLYWMHVRRKTEEPWHAKTIIKTDVDGLRWGQTDVVSLSNGNLAMGSRSKLVIWSSAGIKISSPDLTAYTLGVREIQALPRGGVLTASCDGFLAHMWSSEGNLLKTLAGHTGKINCLGVFSDGRMMTGSEDHTARLWSEEGVPLGIYSGYASAIIRVAPLLNGGFATLAEGQGVALWISEDVCALEDKNGIKAFTVLPNGNVVTVSKTEIAIWSVAGSNIKRVEYELNPPELRDIVTIKPDDLITLSNGSIALALKSAKIIFIWSSSGELIKRFKFKDAITCIAPMIGGGFIATSSENNNIFIMSNNGEMLANLTGHRDRVRNVVALPNGNVVSSSANDCSIRVWSPNLAPPTLSKSSSCTVS